MEKGGRLKAIYFTILMGIAIAVLLLIDIYNFLLFHSLIEIFSVLVSFTIFIIAFNSRKYIKNNFFIFIGTGYLFVGMIDLLHTLAYKGMGVFPGYGTNLTVQLWISARYLESFMLFFGLIFISYYRNTDYKKIFSVFLIVSSIILISIFYIPIFPVTYLEGSGLTSFKIYSEYLISIILFFTLIYIYKNKDLFTRYVFILIFFSVLLTIFSEIAFTMYVGVYGHINMIGHIFKLVSFILIYESLVVTGIRKPFSTLFKDIKDKEKKLEKELKNTRRKEKRIERLKKEYEIIFNNTQDAMFLVKVDGEDFTFLKMNAAYERLSGLDNSEIEGKSPEDVLDEEDAEEVKKRYRECYYKREPISYDIKLNLPAGGKYWDTKLTPVIVDDEVKLIVGAARDITEEKEAKEREEFLHTLLRHDIRNKVQVVHGYLQLLEEDESLSDKSREFLEKALKGNKEGIELMQKLRLMLKAKEEKKEVVDLISTVEEAVNASKSVVKNKSMEINLECLEEVEVLGGPLLEQVFTNLIENSAFHSKGDEIRISCEINEQEVVCIIEDDGIGIPDKIKDEIFERGFTTDKDGGSGLGMFLVKMLLNSYDGSIEVKDSELGGARFDVHLKRAG